MTPPSVSPTVRRPETVLQAYLLGTVEFESLLALQRRLVYDVTGERSQANLLLCEHPRLVSVGREGSRAHILCEPEELHARRWPVRWVNRGGGCLLHAPGQLAVYPILPLDQLGLTLQDYLDILHRVLTDMLAGFGLTAHVRAGQGGVWVGSRLIAHVGVAVRDWVSYYGLALNVTADLEPFRLVRCGGPGEGPMTSLQRELRTPVRMAAVRQRLLDLFHARFGFDRLTLFHAHPALPTKAPTDDAVASRPG
jgi:lipoyl(octanoyl) transferase